MEQLDLMQISLALASERPDLPGMSRREPALPLPADHRVTWEVGRAEQTSGQVREAAAARLRHELARLADDFLDREGFVDTFVPPPDELALALGRVYWRVPAASGLPRLEGQHGTGTLDESLDLLERLLAHLLHGLVGRARGDLQTLGVDIDMLKYVRLPVRRLALGDALDILGASNAGGLSDRHEDALPQRCGEPIFVTFYAAPDGAPASCRLLLPGAGCAGSACENGRLTFDLGRLARFALEPRCARLARPALGRG